MSGHSKWATIHREKGIKDVARGNLFSKLALAITIAVKTGGGSNPDSNYRLRIAIDKARESNMPKDNIERAITKGENSKELMEEVTYEAFGPSNIQVLVQAATDNRNRTGQEIKNLIEKNGGKFVSPGAISYNFSHKGIIVIDNSNKDPELMLKLIDLGVSDIEEEGNNIEVYVEPSRLFEFVKIISSDLKAKIITNELIMKPSNYQMINSKEEAKRVINFLQNLEEHEDVHKVFTNVDIPQEYAENHE